MIIIRIQHCEKRLVRYSLITPRSKMDVKEHEWSERATERIDLYFNRGGVGRGDEAQLLGASDLKNTIGIAMGHQMQDPLDWTEDEKRSAENGQLVYFKGAAREAIDIVYNQIIDVCDGDMTNYVTVLPIELYYQEKMYEVPLFRVQRYKYAPTNYVDSIGRSYTSVDDWYDNNKLLSGKMAYPEDLELEMNSEHTHCKISVADTPAARPESQITEAIDTAASVATIASAVGLMFVTGGLVTPLLLTAVGGTVWSTARAGQRLADRETHGETVNPLADSESRMLWLSIAANLFSFGAMGASWRLSSLALRGQTISNAFRIFTNIAAGTNLVVSGIAIVDSTIFLIDHYHELTKADVLMLVASIAFWTRGAYTYKTANVLITDAQNAAFKQISGKLSQQHAADVAAFRRQFQSDQQLLREYHIAGKLGISPTELSQILVDAHTQGEIHFDAAGTLVLPGEQRFSYQFLNNVPRDIRVTGFQVLAGLTPEQARVLNDFRQYLNNDMVLIRLASLFETHLNWNPRESIRSIISFWGRYTDINLANTGTRVRIVEDSLVIGAAPPVSITTLPSLSNPVIRFIGEHLSRMDPATSRYWSSLSVPVLVNLESHGLLRVCPVTEVVPGGRSVVLLNNELQISIFRLDAILADDCMQIFSLIGQLPSTVTGSSLPYNVVKLCVSKYRLRFECQRRECVQWMTEHVQNHDSLRAIIGAELQTFEMDRLYTFKSTLSGSKAESYMGKMMSFIAEMNPKNISEIVSYGEFAVTYVDTQRAMVAEQLRNKTLKVPHNANGKEWTRQMATETAFKNMDSMKQKFNELLTIVRNNNMTGVEQLSKGLCDQDLVAAIRERNIKFGSDISAAYHIYKHEVGPHDTYITRANEAIRLSGDRYTVTLTQDGDARLINFIHETGSSVLLERDWRVLLCTYIAKKK